jgi:hypothetical protein
MTGKQGGEGRMNDERKAKRRRQNGRWQESREEKAEWKMRGKQIEEGRMEDDRKAGRRRQNGR